MEAQRSREQEKQLRQKLSRRVGVRIRALLGGMGVEGGVWVASGTAAGQVGV